MLIISYFSLLFFINLTNCLTQLPKNCIKSFSDPNDPIFNNQCIDSTLTCNFLSGLKDFIGSDLPDNISPDSFVLCIYLQNYTINIGPNLRQDFDNSVYIQANNVNFMNNYTILVDYELVIKAELQIQTNNKSFISAGLVWFQGQYINLQNSTIQNSSYLQSECNCYDQIGSNCQFEWKLQFPILFEKLNSTYQQYNIQKFSSFIDYDQLLPYNSIILLSLQQLNITSSSIISSIIGLYSPSISLSYSTISTTGNGYPSATGYGCGYFDQILNQLLGCTGSGGSYGGFGGNSSPDNCNLMISKTPYQITNNYNYPSIPGSGGGFFIPQIKQASSGGGIVNIQGLVLQIWNSTIQANGKAGTQGGGGGSGGSVALDYKKIKGNSTITANGGAAKSSGGGGRIWLWNHNWLFQVYNQNLSQFLITANGGGGCQRQLSCGEKGSIITSPCQPGYQLNLNNFICQPCNSGFYQSQYGYTQCQSCLNNPKNSNYPPDINTTIIIRQSYDSCIFVCNPGYELTNNGSYCQTKFIIMINAIGGINTLISVGIVLGVIIIYLIVLLFQKLTEKELFIKKEQKSQFQRKMYFRVEDIPFHEKRIYFSGVNTPKRPWYIPEQTKEYYFRYAQGPITKLESILNRIFKQLNQVCKYSKFKIFIIYILKILYYPMSKYLESLFSEHISAKVQKLIIQTSKKIPQSQNLCIKFHFQPYYRVGCIEIFNYSKSALDFYIQNYFPIYFQLQKMPLGGYAIDLSDPFMKAFITQVDQKSQNKMYERYIIELDQLMRNTQQLIPILNHLYTMTQYNPSIQVYLYQPPNFIIGIQKQYQIRSNFPLFLVFSSQTINCQHFIYSNPLQLIYHDKIDYFKCQYNFRQQFKQQDKKSVFWQIDNNWNEKLLSWMLGIVMILLLVQFVVEFFILIFVTVEATEDVQFNYGIIVYFLLQPFNQFFMVALAIKLILTKSCSVLANSLYFSLANIVKYVILFILGLVKVIGMQQSSNTILIWMLFYLWIVSVICTIIGFLLQLMLHSHYSKHNLTTTSIINEKKLL